MIEQYPEDREKVFNRAIICAKNFKHLYRDSEHKIAHLVVTHGKVVQDFARYTIGGNRGTELEGEVKVSRYVEYNGIATLAVKDNSWRLYRGGDNEHLK